MQRWPWDDEEEVVAGRDDVAGGSDQWTSPGPDGNDASPAGETNQPAAAGASSAGAGWTSGGTAVDAPHGLEAENGLLAQVDALTVQFLDAHFPEIARNARVARKRGPIEVKTCQELVRQERAACDSDSEALRDTIAIAGSAVSAAVGPVFFGVGAFVGEYITFKVAEYARARWASACAEEEVQNMRTCTGLPPKGGAKKGVASAATRLITPCQLGPDGLVKDTGPPETFCRLDGCQICFYDAQGQFESPCAFDHDCAPEDIDPAPPPGASGTGCQGQCNQGPIPQPMVRRGSVGPSIGELQEKLNSVTIVDQPLVTDCEFGPATDRVVRQFQSDESLGADGIVGPRTWERLDALAFRPSCPS